MVCSPSWVTLAAIPRTRSARIKTLCGWHSVLPSVYASGWHISQVREGHRGAAQAYEKSRGTVWNAPKERPGSIPGTPWCIPETLLTPAGPGHLPQQLPAAPSREPPTRKEAALPKEMPLPKSHPLGAGPSAPVPRPYQLQPWIGLGFVTTTHHNWTSPLPAALSSQGLFPRAAPSERPVCKASSFKEKTPVTLASHRQRTKRIGTFRVFLNFSSDLTVNANPMFWASHLIQSTGHPEGVLGHHLHFQRAACLPLAPSQSVAEMRLHISSLDPPRTPLWIPS